MAGNFTTNPDFLVTLVHHRWNIPLIALLHQQSGAKHITLVNQLQLSRSALSVALEYLMQMGLVDRNPGYGHPMRPEYVLSPDGKKLGPACLSLANLIHRSGQDFLAYRKWSLPTIALLGAGQSRFNELRKSLPGAGPRALTLCLKALVKERWATRTVVDRYPPTVSYELTDFGKAVFGSLSEIPS